MAAPAIDFVERDDAYEVQADLPGMDEKDIAVKVVGDVLTIKGETHEEKEEKKPDFHLRERRFGAFERVLRVPEASTRQDRGELQEGRPDGHAAEDRQGAEAWRRPSR